MKFLKTIRFDTSDDNVFELGAAPDEWAVSGGFAFADMRTDEVKGKTKQAFANGFLSLSSFGRSTFASVAEFSDEDMGEVEDNLVKHFIEHYGAPDSEAAGPAAREEVKFILDLCETSLINTIFTVRRSFDEDGQITEEFRTIKSPDTQPVHSRIWNVVEDNE
jgi:hypothetical protein